MAEAQAARSRVAAPGIAVPLWRLGNAALIIWLVFAVVTNSGGLSYTNYRVAHLATGALLVGYGLSLIVRRKLPGPTALDLPIAALLAVNVVAVALSPYTGVTFEAGLEAAAVVVAFYALVDAQSMEVETLVRAFIFIGALLAVLGMLGFVLLYAGDLALKQATLTSLSLHEWLPRWYRPYVFYHPNILASALDLVLPFALALAFYAPSRVGRLMAAAACALCVVALITTDSRGAWLGLLVALPVFLLLTLSSRRVDAERLKQWLIEHRRRVAAALVAAGLGIALLMAALLVTQPPWLFRSTAGSRFDLLRGAFHLISRRPLLGYGTDSPIGLLFPTYNLNHPHNIYADIVLGSGFVGLAVALVGAWSVARVFARSLQQQTPQRRALAAACIAAAVTLLVHGLVDVPTRATGYVLLAAVVGAIAVRLADVHFEANRIVSYLARGAIVAIIPVCLFAWQRSDAAQSHYAQSQTLAAQGDLIGAAAQAELAAGASHGSIAYQLNAGIIETRAYQQSLDAGRPDATSLDRGIDYLTRAVALDPRGAVVYANLAQAQRLAGDKDAAAAAASKALSLAPGNSFLRQLKDPSLPVAAGSVLEWAGQSDAAVDAYAEAIRVEPSVAAATYWSASPQRAELRRRAIELADVSPCLIGRAVALYGSSTDELPDLISRCRADASTGVKQAALAIMLQAAGHHGEALQQARAAMKSGAPEAHVALGYVIASDDLDQARHEFLAAGSAVKDGPLLLALTYDTRVAPPANAALLQTPEPMPAALQKQLKTEIDRQPSRAASAYFMAQLRRMNPETSLIPGEWLSLMPPRISLELAIVAASQ